MVSFLTISHVPLKLILSWTTDLSDSNSKGVQITLLLNNFSNYFVIGKLHFINVLEVPGSLSSSFQFCKRLLTVLVSSMFLYKNHWIKNDILLPLVCFFLFGAYLFTVAKFYKLFFIIPFACTQKALH